MKKLCTACAVVIFACACASEAHAWPFGGKKSEEKAGDEVKAAAPALSKEEKKQQEQLKAQQKAAEEALKQRLAQQQKITAQLNNQEWQIELTPLNAAANAKVKKEMDVVIFKDNKVSIAGFGKKGFIPTNYSLTVQEDGMIIWETMQTSQNAGTAFWRGEMPKDMLSIRGVVSHVIDAKTKNDYSFVSTSKRNLAAEAK